LHRKFKMHTIKAGVAKLVDAPDLGSGAERRGGSSPSTRTQQNVFTFKKTLKKVYALQRYTFFLSKNEQFS
jgi:hypothetical protein